jgi:FO synthase
MVSKFGFSPLTKTEALALAQEPDISALMHHAALLRDQSHGNVITYSRKVFIPLTHLCRDSCHYCTFARPPRTGEQLYMTPDEVLAVARKGEAAGCTEARPPSKPISRSQAQNDHACLLRRQRQPPPLSAAAFWRT